MTHSTAFVLCQNDYPQSVYLSAEAAESECARLKAEQRCQRAKDGLSHRISHWHVNAVSLVADPYVRPAAEIRAEIERSAATFDPTVYDAWIGNGYRAGLTFALTPPTQEPR